MPLPAEITASSRILVAPDMKKRISRPDGKKAKAILHPAFASLGEHFYWPLFCLPGDLSVDGGYRDLVRRL
jgi:hypothetical protein